MRERKRTGNDGGRKEGIERSCAHTFTAASATSLVPSPSDGCAACAPRTAGRRECVCVLECECVCVPFVRLRNLYETSPHPPSLVSLSYRLRILSPPPLRARAFASHSQREIHTCAHVRLHHSLSQVRAVFVRWARADRQQGSSTHETRCVACPQYRARDPQVRSAGVPLPARGLSIGCALQAAPRRCRSMVQKSERRRPTVQSSQRRSTRVGRCRPVAWPRQALSYSDVSRTRERAHGRADEQIALES